MLTKIVKVGMTLILLWGFLSGAVFLANAQRPYCHVYDRTKPVLQGFGAVYNVFSAEKEVFLKVTCYSTLVRPQIAYTIGNGNQSQLIYKYGYEWKNNQWRQITFGGQIQQGDWIVGEANYVSDMSLQEMRNTNYFVAYVCTQMPNGWKCGCQDQNTCGDPGLWQLQEFKIP